MSVPPSGPDGSGRFASRAARELRRETLIAPEPSLGLVAMASPNDPEPSIEIVDGEIVELDGRARADFDVARPLHRRATASTSTPPRSPWRCRTSELAHRLVDVDVPRAELVRLSRGLTPARLAQVLALLDPVEMMFALKRLRARRSRPTRRTSRT